MAYVLMSIQRLKQRIENGTSYQDDSLNVKEINDAANTMMVLVQQKAFNEDIKVISKNASVSNIFQMNFETDGEKSFL